MQGHPGAGYPAGPLDLAAELFLPFAHGGSEPFPHDVENARDDQIDAEPGPSFLRSPDPWHNQFHDDEDLEKRGEDFF